MTGVTLFLFVTALGLSGIAAYYSIVGLATIFSSAFWAVVLMATILEVSKLVTASWLYHNWNTTPSLLKSYLTAAVVVLMGITSLGIFGFLSNAHVQQGLAGSQLSLNVERTSQQIENVTAELARLDGRLAQLDRSINIQLDANRAANALAARRQQQAERAEIQRQWEAVNQRLNKLQQDKVELLQQSKTLQVKTGPIRYVAEFFGVDSAASSEGAVKWMIVVIVLVFDPLALLMLIAANISWARSRAARDGVWLDPKQGDVRWDANSAEFLTYDDGSWVKCTSDQDLQTVVDAVAAIVDNRLAALSMSPPPAPVDLSPVLAAIESMANQEPLSAPNVDLSPVLEAIRQISSRELDQTAYLAPLIEAWQQIPVSSNNNTDMSLVVDAIQSTKVEEPYLDTAELTSLIESTMSRWLERTLAITGSTSAQEIREIIEQTLDDHLKDIAVVPRQRPGRPKE